jgi:hypothetical protein
MSLQDYMQANAQEFRKQLRAFTDDDMAVRLLEANPPPKAKS